MGICVDLINSLNLYPWLPADLDCYLCNEQIDAEDGFVFWVGKETLVLHETCASNLALHLIADVTRLRMEKE